METRNIATTLEKAREWYKSNDSSLKEVALQAFTKEELEAFDFTTIKTFEDTVNVLDKNNPFVKRYQARELNNIRPYYLAYTKLRIIVSALNEGWEPQFTENDARDYPHFYFFTKKEYNKLSEEQRTKVFLFDANLNLNKYVGLAPAFSVFVSTIVNTVVGIEFCFKTCELALYVGRQFIDIYANFYRK